MQSLIGQVATVAALMLGGGIFAWLTAVAIGAAERRAIGGLGLFFGGLYLALRSGDAWMVGVAVTLGSVGVLFLIRAGLVWRWREPSRLWPVAAVVLIPSAFVGALLLGGVLYSVLEGPARLAARLALR